MWGARAGVQFALVDLALKALPVLIIGGFSSIPGAIIGGLIIGATEKVLEVYIGPYFGGAMKVGLHMFLQFSSSIGQKVFWRKDYKKGIIREFSCDK